MARSKHSTNGRLEDALASLVQAQISLNLAQASLVEANASLAQNQAAFLGRIAEVDARMAQTQREFAATQRENAERFARIEAILLEHSRILRALPDTIRDKIGFRPPGSPAAEQAAEAR